MADIPVFAFDPLSSTSTSALVGSLTTQLAKSLNLTAMVRLPVTVDGTVTTELNVVLSTSMKYTVSRRSSIIAAFALLVAHGELSVASVNAFDEQSASASLLFDFK
jgi:hypothetical protein